MNCCIYCGAPLDSDSQFCANCGKKIKMCPRCGAVLKDDSLFCARCGTRLDTQPVPFTNLQQATSPVTIIQEEAEIADEWEEEENKKWRYLVGGIAVVVLLIVSWLGYTQFYKLTHIDVDKLLVSFLVGNHMRPIVWKESEKAKNRDRENWGEVKFNLISKLGEADQNSL